MNFYWYIIVPFFILGMGSFPGFPTYAATKWGVIGFTKSMAVGFLLF